MDSPIKEENKKEVQPYICKLIHIRKYYIQLPINTFENPDEIEEFYR